MTLHDSFYAHLSWSHHDHVFLCHQDDVTVGAVIVSTDVAGLQRRIWTKTPLIPTLIRHTPRSHILGIMGALNPWPLRESEITTDQRSTLPEALFVFTASAFRRRGIASHLLARSERLLFARGYSRYKVRSGADSTSAASHFYRKRGLQPEITRGHVQMWVKALASV